jgi:hypothetical protein
VSVLISRIVARVARPQTLINGGSGTLNVPLTTLLPVTIGGGQPGGEDTGRPTAAIFPTRPPGDPETPLTIHLTGGKATLPGSCPEGREGVE